MSYNDNKNILKFLKKSPKALSDNERLKKYEMYCQKRKTEIDNYIVDTLELNAKLNNLKNNCIQLYIETTVPQKKFDIYTKEFNGEFGIFFYIKEYFDFVENNLDKVSKGDVMDLLAYNNLLYHIPFQCDNITKKLELITSVDDKTFDAEFNIKIDAERPGVVQPRYKNLKGYKQYKSDLEENLTNWKTYHHSIKENIKQLNAIAEELNNKKVFLKNYWNKDYSAILAKLLDINFHDYKFHDNEDAQSYKERLLALAKELHNILDA